MSNFLKNSLCKNFYFYTFLRKLCIKFNKFYSKSAVNHRLPRPRNNGEKSRISKRHIYYNIYIVINISISILYCGDIGRLRGVSGVKKSGNTNYA